MTDDKTVVPVWTLATRDMTLPPIIEGAMTPERLDELRTVLAVMAEAPIATLEAHPAPRDLDRTRGLRLESASPLAVQLAQLVKQTSDAAPAVGAAASGEVLYRMVVPAKMAAQVGTGMITSMPSKTVAGGIRGALVNSMNPSKIAGQATFVPVAGKTGAAVGTGVLTVAAPLVLMAVAVGVSAYADSKRKSAIQNITNLLKQLHDDALQNERNALNGCRAAIDKATAVLFDQGRVGASLGLDSAVYAIEVGIAQAEDRLKKWQEGLAEIGGKPVELPKLRRTFDGIDEHAGKFYAHLELAELAIASKKRVIVLQAVEHAQGAEGNPLEAFVGELKRDQQRVMELEAGVNSVLLQLSTLQLDRTHGIRDKFFMPGDVDKLLRTSYRLRSLGSGVKFDQRQSDVAIEMVRESDGSVVVFPAAAG
jgi:hypothetical protein